MNWFFTLSLECTPSHKLSLLCGVLLCVTGVSNTHSTPFTAVANGLLVSLGGVVCVDAVMYDDMVTKQQPALIESDLW